MKNEERERLEEIRYLLGDVLRVEDLEEETSTKNYSERESLLEEMWELERKEDLESLDNLIKEKK